MSSPLIRSVSAVLFTALVVVAAALPTATTAGAGSNAEDLPGLDEVVSQLRRGGLVLYFRHAQSSPLGSDEDAVMSRCETQRNLSQEGRVQAAEIGRAIAALNIKIGSVKTSPFCRCRDTAQLAFGHYVVDEGLYFTLATDADARKRDAQSQALRRMLSTTPPVGTNTVLVAHTANLRDAAGLWPKPEGAAYVFQPLGDGKFKAVARITPEAWARLANIK